jgi:diphthine-ammonia ligase
MARVSQSLNVIALISGGKDSLYSILHCIHHGHRIVALANLHPKDVQLDASGTEIENEVDDDSFLYQTIGHSAVPLFEKALELPLYRRAITGTAVDSTLNYTPAGSSAAEEADEAEDLCLLLKDVIKAHPEANAVSCGAILSTYQRMRVESIAIRLNLVPLAYLWEYTSLPAGNDALLAEMWKVGQHAILIKVASGGLDESLLGRDVGDPKTVYNITRRMQRFGITAGMVLGEGGEFETLALDGPQPLWKRKIVVKKSEVLHGEGGSASLRLLAVDTEDYSAAEQRGDVSDLSIPPPFDEEFVKIFQTPFGPSIDTEIQPAGDLGRLWDGMNHTSSSVSSSVQENDSVIRLTNITGPGESAEQQMEAMVTWIVESLERMKYPSSITSTMLILRSMADFQVVNKAYSTMFTSTLPPSRVTISCGNDIPAGKHVLMNVTCCRQRGITRKGLHVQSRSYWAPANIGPYSQAILEPLTKLPFAEEVDNDPALAHMAGQIALDPATMEMYQGTPYQGSGLFKHQSLLAMQHLFRVGKRMKVCSWTGGLAYLSASETQTTQEMVTQALQTWKLYRNPLHSPDSELDEDSLPYEMQTGPLGLSETFRASSDSSLVNVLQKEHKDSPISHSNGENYRYGESGGVINQPCFAVLVSDLPRASPIEWWSLGFSNTQTLFDQDTSLGQDFEVHRTISVLSAVTVTWIAVKNCSNITEVEKLAEFRWSCQRGTQPLTTIYTSQMVSSDFISRWKASIVPSQSVWAETGQVDALLVVIYYTQSSQDGPV